MIIVLVAMPYNYLLLGYCLEMSMPLLLQMLIDGDFTLDYERLHMHIFMSQLAISIASQSRMTTKWS